MSRSGFQRLRRRVIYQSDWVHLYVDAVRLPNGEYLDEYHLLHFEFACVAAVVTDGEGRILLVQVHRYPTDRMEWELPAGRIDPDESVLEAAAREVLEETGYETNGHRLLYSYQPANGISDQTYHLTVCRAVRRVGEPDAREIAAVRWFEREEVLTGLRENRFQDGYTASGLALYLLLEGDR